MTIPGVKVRVLLAALLAHAPHTVSTERLFTELWDDEMPTNPSAALQAKVSQLRRALAEADPQGRQLVQAQTPGYRLRLDRVACHGTPPTDAQRFQELLTAARRHTEPSHRVSALRGALALWRGEAYADTSGSGLTRQAALRLEEQRITALEDLAESRLELGEHGSLVAELEELTAEHPLRERLRAAQMRALYLAGRQGEALERFEEIRTRLRDQLGTDPGPQLVRLHQSLLTQDPQLEPENATRAGAMGPPDTNLPATTSGSGELVGRAAAVSELRSRLTGPGEVRLLNLTGPGGVGKTRLALETAHQLRPEFPDGVWFVDLAAHWSTMDSTEPSGRASPDAPTPEDVAAAVSATLDIREDDVLPSFRPESTQRADVVTRLVSALGARRLLLVLDNCEHVTGAVGTLVERLLAAPELVVLATGREPLGLPAEHVHPVPPLDLPHGEASVAEALATGAVHLFESRAAAASPGFRVTEDNVDAVVGVCHRLDGIPLALELAAPQVRTLGVHELASRLANRFHLLAAGRRSGPERHRTLRATIDWSWELLSPPEQRVLRRLSVHAGSSCLVAVEQVCSDSDLPEAEVVQILTQLVDRSLVQVDWSGHRPRYRLLDVVAAYARERLEAAGEEREFRRRHAEYHARRAARILPRATGPRQQEWLHELDLDSANLRAAIAAAAELDCGQVALHLVNATSWHRFLRGRYRELREALTVALAAAERNHSDISLFDHARGLTWRACVAYLDHRDDSPDALRATALERWEQLKDPQSRAECEWLLALAMLGAGDASVARSLVGSARTTFQELENHWGMAAALSTRAELALVAGELSLARADSTQSCSLFQQLGDRWGQLHPIQTLGTLCEIDGDYAAATRHHRTALRIAEELGNWPSVSAQLAQLGRLALLGGDLHAAHDFHRRALRLAEQQAHSAGWAFAGNGMALVERRSGRLDAAESRLWELLEWNRRAAYTPGVAFILAELGFVAELRGDAETAWRRHTDGLRSACATGDPRAVALTVEGLAGAAACSGALIRAAQLLGTAAAARDAVDSPLPAAERVDVDRILDVIRSGLGEQELEAQWQSGRGMSWSALCAEA
ncbi:BTAD domain-containing putative transcriptional regulator [Lipingzhangella rawalii]|uniref:BTAD domain-containing putative transcriptional regulator n=1 Tax=Lipingzhangella rawalii TaxID=2055835 RepID=UPI00287BAB3B|nr:BTAD domain-containing putative transcriptional regulator [Lipingzhangella rawalii]